MVSNAALKSSNTRRTVVVNVMLSLMSVISPPPASCNLSVRTAV